MELKLESGLPHQEYAVEAISEVFKHCLLYTSCIFQRIMKTTLSLMKTS